jgi:hypothetical protein
MRVGAGRRRQGALDAASRHGDRARPRRTHDCRAESRSAASGAAWSVQVTSSRRRIATRQIAPTACGWRCEKLFVARDRPRNDEDRYAIGRSPDCGQHVTCLPRMRGMFSVVSRRAVRRRTKNLVRGSRPRKRMRPWAAKQTLERTAYATSAADTTSAREVTRKRPSPPQGKPLRRRRRLKANARANSSRARPTVGERSQASR